MARTLLRMERPAGLLEPAMVPGVAVRRWRRDRDHGRIPGVYAAAFGHDPWPENWDGFEEFDPDGVFVAEAGGEAIGFAICFLRREHGYISVVAVVPGFRRRGVASALVGRAVGYLRSRSVESIRIDAYADAPGAVATYRSLGFRVYETVQDEEADPRGSAEE
jgi:ribosomal protein S18 acetylase RimI-like enzyme